MSNTHTTTEWRATPVDRTDNVELVRTHTTYKKTGDGRVLWKSGKPYDSGHAIMPIGELHLVIAELAKILHYTLEEARNPVIES